CRCLIGQVQYKDGTAVLTVEAAIFVQRHRSYSYQFLSGCGKTILAHQNFPGPYDWDNERERRDARDERDEVRAQSVHIAPFSHLSRFTRHGLWCWRMFSASCYDRQGLYSLFGKEAIRHQARIDSPGQRQGKDGP